MERLEDSLCVLCACVCVCIYLAAAFHLCIEFSQTEREGKVNNTFEFNGPLKKLGLHLGAFGDIFFSRWKPAHPVEF